MKDRLCFDFNYIFNDHMAKCSDQAKLYYIKLMFFATNGFVSNPLEVLDSLGYDKGIFYELVRNDEIMTLPGRSEVFITAYFLHTHFNAASWLSSPFAIYWKGHLWTKKNGVATYRKPPEDEDNEEPPKKREEVSKDRWDKLVDDLDD